MQCLTVPGSNGQIFFLDASSGIVLGTLHAGGDVVAAPAVDPWNGHVWLGTHGKELLCIGDTHSTAFLKPGSISGFLFLDQIVLAAGLV